MWAYNLSSKWVHFLRGKWDLCQLGPLASMHWEGVRRANISLGSKTYEKKGRREGDWWGSYEITMQTCPNLCHSNGELWGKYWPLKQPCVEWKELGPRSTTLLSHWPDCLWFGSWSGPEGCNHSRLPGNCSSQGTSKSFLEWASGMRLVQGTVNHYAGTTGVNQDHAWKIRTPGHCISREHL